MDPLTIEITAQEALRRSLGGLTAGSFADLLALADLDGLDSSLARPLDTFATRMSNEIADLPPTELKGLIEELDQIDAKRISDSLRLQLGEAVEAAGLDKLHAVIDAWGPAEAFPLGGAAQAPRVKTAPEARRNDARFQDRRVGGRGEPPTRRRRASSGPKAKTLDLGGTTDRDRDRWVEQACLERLAGVTDAGLLEAVLLAGVRHGARNKYPDLGGHEVKGALDRLKDRGAVRYSAGRWSHAGRRW